MLKMKSSSPNNYNKIKEFSNIADMDSRLRVPDLDGYNDVEHGPFLSVCAKNERKNRNRNSGVFPQMI